MGFGSFVKKAGRGLDRTVRRGEREARGQIKTGIDKSRRDISRIDWKKFYREYDRYTSSQWGAYLTPALSYYDSDGRQALREAYGGYVSTAASAYNPALGQAVNTGLAVYDARYANQPRVAAPTAPAAEAFTPASEESAAPPVPVIVGGIVAALAIVAAVYFWRR